MKITPELLKKYSEGNCTEDEIRLVESWLSSLDDDAVLSDKEIGDSIYNIRTKLHTTLSDSGSGSKVIPLYKKVMRYASAVIILLFVGVAAYYYLHGFDPDAGDDQISLQEFRHIKTQRGQKRTIDLPDGSTIRLNYESELKIPEKFSGVERIVFLTGHAHFDVAEDPDRPFIIFTNNSKTRVLGTSFDIKTHTNADHTEVIVTSGRVEFSEKAKGENKVVLTVNDRAVLRANHEIDVSEVNAQMLTAWKDNRLVFDYKPLSEIIEVLEPWYDVEITVKDPALLDKIHKLSYDNPSLETLMEQMSFVANFNYTIEGKQVTIY